MSDDHASAATTEWRCATKNGAIVMDATSAFAGHEGHILCSELVAGGGADREADPLDQGVWIPLATARLAVEALASFASAEGESDRTRQLAEDAALLINTEVLSVSSS